MHKQDVRGTGCKGCPMGIEPPNYLTIRERLPTKEFGIPMSKYTSMVVKNESTMEQGGKIRVCTV